MSHVSLKVADIARDHGLTILTFPPHCSHRLQPLDISVYGPLKKFYNKAVNEWNLSRPGKIITIYDLPGCFKRAFHLAFSHANIVQGFLKSGIYPLNSDIFQDSDYLSSTVFTPVSQQECVTPTPGDLDAPTTGTSNIQVTQSVLDAQTTGPSNLQVAQVAQALSGLG